MVLPLNTNHETRTQKCETKRATWNPKPETPSPKSQIPHTQPPTQNAGTRYERRANLRPNPIQVFGREGARISETCANPQPQNL